MTTIRSSHVLAASNAAIENQPAFAGHRNRKRKAPPTPAQPHHTATPTHHPHESPSIGKVLKTLFFGWLLLSAGTGLGVAAKPLRNRSNNQDGNSHETEPSNALQLMRCPPFPPTNTTLFTPQTYTGAPPLIPASMRPTNETAILEQLQTTLEHRFPQNETVVEQTLNLFDDPQIQRVIPDPRLRAALVTLKGTVGEPAIDSIQNGTFKAVRFADLPGDIIAVSQLDSRNETKPSIVFNTRYQHEDFRLLAPTMLHETLHTDIPNSLREERISTTLDTTTYAQFVVEDPTLAHSGTEMSRRYNTRLMAIVNSRTPEGKLRPFTAQAGNVFPDGRPLNNFGDAFLTREGKPINDSSPGNSELPRVLKLATGVERDQPNFDAATDEDIDQHPVTLPPEKVIQLAQEALKLNTTCDTDTQEPEPVTSGASPRANPSIVFWSSLATSAATLLNQFWGRFRA